MKKRTQANGKFKISLIGILLGGMTIYAQNTWRVPGDFADIQSALDSSQIAGGDTIEVGPGEFAGAVITRSVTLVGRTNTVISSPATNSETAGVGFLFPGNGIGSGSTIQGFSFTNLSLPILSMGANDVVIFQNDFWAPEQGITSLGGTNLAAPLTGYGNRWIIAQNQIRQPLTYGILFEELVGNELSGNIVIRNTISGTNDLAGSTNFSMTGIAYIGNANAGPGSAFRNNTIVYNQVALTNGNTAQPAIGILLWQQNASTNSPTNSVSGNLIARNDLNAGRPVYLDPANLSDYNNIAQTLIEPGTVEGSTPDLPPQPAPGPVPGEDPGRPREIEVVEGTIGGQEPAADPTPAPNPNQGEDPNRP